MVIPIEPPVGSHKHTKMLVSIRLEMPLNVYYCYCYLFVFVWATS